MAVKIRRLGTLAVLAAVLLLAVVLLGLSYSEVGVANEIGVVTLGVWDSKAVPQSVSDDAIRVAAERFGGSLAAHRDFVNQLIATYVEATGKDFVILFNPGGWGGSTVDQTPGWLSILDGMKSRLDEMGYSSLLLDYQRTSANARGRIKELVEMFVDYPSKAVDLAARVKFLTDHIPDLKVIVAGESNGSVISDSAMGKLQDNPNVYSIQTGPPFWEKPSVQGRTLVLKDNGVAPDSYTDADVITLLWSNVKALLRLSPKESPGTILTYLRAPGHDYSWQYPKVADQIMKFLEDNFGVKRG